MTFSINLVSTAIADTSLMKKVYRRSQITKFLGRSVGGMHMHRYGLPYQCAGGLFSDTFGPDSMDYLHAAADRYFPEIHIASMMPNGTLLNRFEEGAVFYQLRTGNADPSLEFTKEFSWDDLTEEELLKEQEQQKRFRETVPTLEHINAIKWMLERSTKLSKLKP